MRQSSCTCTRRDLLAGSGAWAALSAMLRSGEAQIISRNAVAQNTAGVCIFVNLNGAPSHVDTFDLKEGPWTPRDAAIQQYPGGIVLSRTLFPKLSNIAADLCLLRSIESYEAAHERGQFYLQTGHSSNPAFNAETPHIGAVAALEALKRGTVGNFPAFLALNGPSGQGATFLGGRYEPVAAPASPAGFSTLAHDYFGSQSQARFEQKYRLLLDADPARQAPYDGLVADHAAYYATAKAMMYDPAISSVFQMSADDRGRYGDTPFGRACIVARNAINAQNGIRFINITHDGWDTHQSMFVRGYGDATSRDMYTLSNELDRGIGTLVEDLKASGQFGKTLIVMMGEFGRTPGDLNGRGGRDHHKKALCAVMLGGGVSGGRVIGQTDKIGKEIVTPGWSQDRHIYMEDITATIYSALGIDWTQSITDTPSGRKFEYVPGAFSGRFTAITEVFG